MLTKTQINNIQKSWSRDTCYPPDQDKWSESNPTLGQCAVTALLVQDLIGGSIVFSKQWDHYWNRADNMTEIDLTRGQFPQDIEIRADEIVTRESLLSGPGAIRARTAERYDHLKKQYNSYS